MKRICIVLLLLCAVVLFIPCYAEAQVPEMDFFRQEGIASWYGPEFEGRPTASGEIFDPSFLTAAHPSLPFGTMLVITNQHNNKKVTVRVNDRGPFVAARIIDVSQAAAQELDMLITGTAPVLIESVDRIVSSAVTTEPVYSPEPVDVPLSNPVSQAVPPLLNSSIALNPNIAPAPNKVYRLQVGSYKVARNAVDAFEKLKNAGLNPAYERNGDYFRVVLAGIQGSEVQLITEKIGLAGFREALIREEH
jgi:rare lipoprotein A